MRLKIFTIILLLLAISNLFGNSNDNIRIFTEETAPYSMMIDGKLTGRSVEILDAMFKQMKSKQSLKDVRLTTWVKAYSIAQKKKNTMVFSTARTKEREQLFKWVGPIFKSTIGIIAPKRKKIKINKVSDLNKYRVGAVLKDVGEMLLLSNGVKKDAILHMKGDNAIGISFKKMKNNTIDMFAYDIEGLLTHRQDKGLDVNEYEVIYILQQTDLYFAFNKNTDDAIVNKWQKALDKIKSNGLFDKIIKEGKTKINF